MQVLAFLVDDEVCTVEVQKTRLPSRASEAARQRRFARHYRRPIPRTTLSTRQLEELATQETL